MKPVITVIGSTNWDLSMKVPNLPQSGETVMGGHCDFCLGGKGANQAIAALYAGAQVHFVSCIGDDSFAVDVKNAFDESGLSTSGLITITDIETGKAFIFVDENAENCIGVADGANAYLSADIVESNCNVIEEADLLLLQMEIPFDAINKAAQIARNKNTTVILNPAPATHFSPILLESVSFITPNRTEMEKISQSVIRDLSDLRSSARFMLDAGLEAVIVTLGNEGVIAMTPEQEYKFPAHEVTAIDTTAAGDVFNGAFASALVSGGDLQDAIQFAIAASALCVQKRGAIPSIPQQEEIIQLINT